MTKIKARESQNVEYKSRWHDEYLKWICGFANAQGAVMYFGVNDDHEGAGFPMPKIEPAFGGVQVTFRRNNVNTASKHPENGGDVGIDSVAEKLTEKQKDILEILQDVAVNVAVNTKYLSERMHVNRKTIQRELVGLQKQKLVQWVGSDKTGHWEIIVEESDNK